MYKYQTHVKGDKHKPINLGEMLAQFMATDSVNKIDSQFHSGLDNLSGNYKQLSEMLYDSDFITEREIAGKQISFNGERFLAVIYHNNKPLVTYFTPHQYTRIKHNILEMTAVAKNKTYYTEEKSWQLYYHWSIREDGRVIRRNVIEENGEYQFVNHEDEFVYPKSFTGIPGKLIRNNSISEPDWVKAATILAELDALSNDIGEEWEYTKTQFQNMGSFGAGKKGHTRHKEIVNGERINDTFSPNGKFAQAFQAIISGSASASQLISTIVYLEDRAMKYSFQGRDMDNSGTNKHTTQVGLFNQAHSEYTQRKIRQRQRDYEYFLNDVVKPFLKFKVPKSVKITMSEFEKGKVDGVQATGSQRKLNDAQSNAQNAQAEKHKAAAIKLEEESKNLNTSSNEK